MFEDQVISEGDDSLGPEEETAIIAFAVILTETQLSAVVHFFCQELARRQGITEQTTMNIPINGLIALTGGKL